MEVASKVGNLHSEFGHAIGFLCSRIIRYVRDGRTARRTDGRTKATLIDSFPMGGGIISKLAAVIIRFLLNMYTHHITHVLWNGKCKCQFI